MIRATTTPHTRAPKTDVNRKFVANYLKYEELLNDSQIRDYMGIGETTLDKILLPTKEDWKAYKENEVKQGRLV